MSNVAIRGEHPVEVASSSHHAHDEHGHGEHGHGPAHLHHHFADEGQQRESNALGMWVFLVTEVMTFGALFFVYTLYRYLFETSAAQMPGGGWASPYAAGSHLLNNTLGFINTLVLLGSSLTVAAAVHAAGQRNKKNLLRLLVVTWILGFLFLGIKAVEWRADWDEGLVPGLNWNPKVALAHKGFVLSEPTGVNGQAYFGQDPQAVLDQTLKEAAAQHGGAGAHAPAAHGNDHGGGHGVPKIVNGMHLQMFFVIYFCMAGLHAIHMIIGLGLLAVFIFHAKRDMFTLGNDQPIEIFGLYWHFVDIVWIFLYPLLYLIAH